MKVCKKCLVNKDDEKFPRHPQSRDGLAGSCKECKNQRLRERYAADPVYRQKRQEKGIRWTKNNPEKAKSKQRRNYTPEKGWRRHRKFKYGLTDEQFSKLEASQNKKCAVCKKEKRLVIDHNHKTGLVRGLLCYRCNTLVGLFENIGSIAESIKRYLRLPE